MQLMALYCANLARLLRPQGAPFLLELEYVSTFAALHLAGWADLPFLSSGQVSRSGLRGSTTHVPFGLLSSAFSSPLPQGLKA